MSILKRWIVPGICAAFLLACGATETVPSQEIDASDASDQADASDASDASDAADATDASDATDPSDSVDASDSSDATDSSDASDISDSADTTDPSDGSDESDATDPGDQGPTLDSLTAYHEPGLFTYELIQSRDMELSTGRDVEITVCRPTGEGPKPLVIISPGFQLGRDLYQSYCEHFASWGFIAVTQTYSPDVSGFASSNHEGMAQDTNALVDALVAEAANGLEVDGERVAFVGHSLGGKVSILASTLSDRALAVVGLDPVDANEPSVTPELMPSLNGDLLLLGETLDATGLFQACAPEADNFQQYFAASPAGTVQLDVLGAGHMQFHDNPNCLACRLCNGSPTADANEVLEISRHASTQFLLSRLQDFGGWGNRVAEGLLDGQNWSTQAVQTSR